jgi:hypothetical protein
MLNIFPRLCFKSQISYIHNMSNFSSEQSVTKFLNHLTTLHQMHSLYTTVAFYIIIPISFVCNWCLSYSLLI